MSKFYSKTTGGFYDPEINIIIPQDVVAVTNDNYEALFTAQAMGKVIKPDAQGNPEAVTFIPSAEQLHAALLVSAKKALEKSDVVVLRCIEDGILLPSAWATYRQTLRAIGNGTQTCAIPVQPAYPS